MRVLSLLCLAAMIGVGPGRVRAERGEAGDMPADRQCGARSLYLLLNLEGRPIAFTALASSMPAPGPGGFSMEELRDAARAHGLHLRGVRLSDRASRIDRAMILRFDDGEHGHFLVARPVGHTGDHVQVLDPSSSTSVVDIAALRASPDWTGYALIPTRQHRTVKWVVAGALVTVGAGILRSAGTGTRTTQTCICPASMPPAANWLNSTYWRWR